MSDASSVAVVASGNTQIVLFGMFIIFVMVIIFFCRSSNEAVTKTETQTGGYWWYNWSCVPLVPFTKLSDCGSLTPDLTVRMEDEKPKIVTPLEKTTIAESKENKNELVYPMSADSPNDNRVQELERKVRELEEKLTNCTTRIVNLEEDKKKREYDDNIKRQISMIQGFVDKEKSTDIVGGNINIGIKEKPLQEVINHFRQKYSDLTVKGNLNNNLEVTSWVFVIPVDNIK